MSQALLVTVSEITHPKPLDELPTEALRVFASSQPWVEDAALSPKSVVRDMWERAMTFAEYVQHYGLSRSEGLVLRYLSDAYRAIRQTVPEEAKGEELVDVIEWLGSVVRQVDSSLLDEWEQLLHPAADDDGAPIAPPPPPTIVANPRAFRILVRNALFQRVQLAALDRVDALGELDPAFGRDAWADALDAYYAEHDVIGVGADARSAPMLDVEESATAWEVQQILADPAGDHDWRIWATVDLEASAEAGEVVLRVTRVGRL